MTSLRAAPQSHRLLEKLSRLGALSASDGDALMDLPVVLRSVDADTQIATDGDRPTHCPLLLDGFVARHKDLPGGERQITSFHIPGDMLDLQSLQLAKLDHSMSALVASDLAMVDHRHLRTLVRAFPDLYDLFWRDTLVDASIYREWMTGIGRRDAKGRVAHLLCELLVKYRAAGLTHDHHFRLVVTQAELGDALGLSTVHVNRVLQDLRAERIIAPRSGDYVNILEWEGLQAIGTFDPTYLHMTPREG